MSVVPLPDNVKLIPQVARIVSVYTKRNEVSDRELSYLCNALQHILTGSPSSPVIETDFSPVPAEMAALKSNDHLSMSTIPESPKASDAVTLQPAVPVAESVQPDFIICLEDGAKVKLLKRYIQSRFALTPAEYRAKWNLPADYPMTAPNYSKRRAELARAIGLGQMSEPDASADPDLRDEPGIPAAATTAEIAIPQLTPDAIEPQAVGEESGSHNNRVSDSAEPPALAKPVSSRPILRLAAWQKPAEPKAETAQAVTAPEEPAPAPKSPETAAESEGTIEPPVNRGFRYPVNRYSR